MAAAEKSPKPPPPPGGGKTLAELEGEMKTDPRTSPPGLDDAVDPLRVLGAASAKKEEEDGLLSGMDAGGALGLRISGHQHRRRVSSFPLALRRCAKREEKKARNETGVELGTRRLRIPTRVSPRPMRTVASNSYSHARLRES